MSIVFFLISVVAFVLAVSGIRPPMTSAPAALRPPWMQVMVINEFAPTWMIGSVAVLAIGVALGALSTPLGAVGAALLLATIVMLAIMMLRAARALRVVREVLGPDVQVRRPAYRVRQAVFPYPYFDDPEIERIDDMAYAPGLALDLYRSRLPHQGPSPLLVHIHGGSWGGGNRREQAQPLIREMARRGWVVSAIDYPLIPSATNRDQVIAIHQALRWLRDHAEEYAIAPEALFVTGGSAGAQLGAVVALTDHQSEVSQRRPDEAPIAGAVVFYGIYDMLNRHGVRDDWPFIPRDVIQADPANDVEPFRSASPIDLIRSEAPPFLIIHGDHDSLVPVGESEYFAHAFAIEAPGRASFVQVPGATHAFDAVPSIRTQNTVAGVAAWLEDVADDAIGTISS